nr:MAG TPA: Photosystem I reaction centre subunit IV / PsaE [Caudoviricetes sp.]
MKFKVGDKVKCIRRRGYQLTKIGSVYTVDGYRENGNVMLKELPCCAYNSNDFKLVTNKTFFKKLPNDYTGTLEVENGYIVEKEILDEEEKEYLSAVIKPFRYKIEYIAKHGGNKEYIDICIRNDSKIIFPYFKSGTMYKGMELNKKYTLEELGLDE